jgi:hypothetical protein
MTTCVEVDVGGIGQRFSWVDVMDSSLELDVSQNDSRSHKSNREPFVSSLVETHALGVKDFRKKFCDSYYSFGMGRRPDEFSMDEIKDHIVDGVSLLDRHLAQISGLWTARS